MSLSEDLLDRKAMTDKLNFERIDKLTPVWRKRQMILSGEPDILSEDDLFRHRFENKFKRGIKYLSVTGFPLLYYFYYKRNVNHSLCIGLFSYMFVKFYINSLNFTKCDYSLEYALNTYKNSNVEYNKFNGFYKMTSTVFWNLDSPVLNGKYTVRSQDVQTNEKVLANMQQI